MFVRFLFQLFYVRNKHLSRPNKVNSLKCISRLFSALISMSIHANDYCACIQDFLKYHTYNKACYKADGITALMLIRLIKTFI